VIALVALAPTAAQVLADVQKHYAQTAELDIEFTQTVTNATFGTSKTTGGQLWLGRPKLFRMEYADKQKPVRMFIFDGTDLWIVDHKNLEIIQNKKPQVVLPALFSFLSGGALTGTYDISLSANTLVMTPKQPLAEIKTLSFVVDPRASEVTEAIVLSPSNDVNDMKFTTQKSVPLVAPLFAFTPKSYPNYKLIVVP
jgi:chaperone LolA